MHPLVPMVLGSPALVFNLMKLTILGSSSNGNGYLLESGNQILMLECGVRYKELQQALEFNFSKVCGGLLTHEHNDHSKAAKETMMAGIDVYASWGTFNALKLGAHRSHIIQALKQFTVGRFIILPFTTQHDAAEPLGFLIFNQDTGEKLLFATDTYYVKNRFQGLNYIMVECNYCLDILKDNVAAGLVPEALKNRLIQSHFSLDNVKNFLQANVTSDTRKIVLMHLSDDNSDAIRMQSEVQALTGVETVVADCGLIVDLELYPF